MKEWLKKLLPDIRDHIIKNLVWYLLSTGGLLLLLKYFKQLLTFLSTSVNILIGIALILLLLSFLAGYKLGRPKRKKEKHYFYPYANLKWWITEYETNVDVEKIPYCEKCETRCILEGTRFEVFDSICSNPDCVNIVNQVPLRITHQAVKNIFESKLKQKLKS